MTIVVTAATGQLGQLVLDELLKNGVAATEIVAGGRSNEKLKRYADQGVRVQEIDYDKPDTLAAAFAGADKVLFISGSEPGKRIQQHKNVIDAAKAANVGLIAYTGILNADTTTMKLAAEHLTTEAALKASGLPVILLRHGWYLENYTGQIPGALERGALAGSAGKGRISAATRADFAAADVRALLDGRAGDVYELGGDEAFTLSELAAEIARQSGQAVVYSDLPQEQYHQILTAAGVPAPMDEILADTDRAIADGELFTDSGDLSRLLGHPTTPMSDAVRAAL